MARSGAGIVRAAAAGVGRSSVVAAEASLVLPRNTGRLRAAA